MANETPRRGLLSSLRDLVRPPDLQTDEDRSASRLELFFDLAFVLVVAELAIALRVEVTWESALTFAGLFALVWWAWVSATLYANRFDHDDVVFRLYKLAGMAAVVGLAAAATEATGERFGIFVGCQLALRLVLLLQYLRVYRHRRRGPPGRAALSDRRRCGCAAVGRLVARAPAGRLRDVGRGSSRRGARPAGGHAIVVGRPTAHRAPAGAVRALRHPGARGIGGRRGPRALRRGLDGVVDPGRRAVLRAGGCPVVELLRHRGARAKRLLNEAGGERSSNVHDAYIFGQLPLTLGLASVGAGIELAVVQSGAGEVPTGSRLLLAGGVAVYLVSVAVTETGMSVRSRRHWWWPLAAAGLALLDVVLELPAVVVVGALAALLVAVTVTGMVERATGELAVDPV